MKNMPLFITIMVLLMIGFGCSSTTPDAGCDYVECDGLCCAAGQECFSGSCCTPLTCQELDKLCGDSWDNQCGSTANCGSCAAFETCSSEGECSCQYESCGGNCCGEGIACDGDKCAASAFDGYTLFNPVMQTNTYLIDMQGNTVHSWTNLARGGYSVYLLEDGYLMRPGEAQNIQLRGGAAAGLLQKIDASGNVVWEFEYNSATYLTHHDIEPMPNGNVLLIAWEVKSAAEAVAAGRSKNAEFWPDHLIEVDPTRAPGQEIVWEWHVFDHLVQDYDDSKANYAEVAKHPELIDVNLGADSGGPGMGGDWLHINGVSYNPELDQIAISSHFVDEFFVIDHSTADYDNPAAGIALAAGHTGGQAGKGGDILYRWGSPVNYGAPGDTVFDVIHCAAWIPAGYPGEGNILVYNNGEHQRQSEIVELTPPRDLNGDYILGTGSAFGPQSPTWRYFDGSDFYSAHLGSNQRLPNGNTLISESTSAYLFEVTQSGEIVWEYQGPGEIARSLRYAPDYPGLPDF
ncbi:MAG: aryl-sulfate sulfotransferase [Deltaproteobacteria bacterium]|nr:aryl-sulfate sulfotransferase [Deltaproteobacteria bacterium]